MTDSHAIGTVIGQSIPVGQLTLQGTWIHLTLSSGPAPTVVPVGQDWFEIFAPLINSASNTWCTDVPGGTSVQRPKPIIRSGIPATICASCSRMVLAPRAPGFTNGSPYQFELRNAWFPLCMAAANNSDSNGTALTTAGCTVGGTQTNTFALG